MVTPSSSGSAATARREGLQDIPYSRPALVTATRHVISAGHYLAAHAGFEILEAGGNAIDAGVAAGICLGVVIPDLVNVAGVAPIILYHAESRQIFTVSGLGPWPAAVTPDYFVRRHGGKIPRGLLRTVVPAAPDAFIRTLDRFGTMTFADVTKAAICFARDGFPAHTLLCEVIAEHEQDYAEWASNRAIFLQHGRPPKVGELFVQADLARSLQYMVDEERAHAGNGRSAGLEAARAAFYKGDIARTITRFHAENGGLLTMADMAQYASEIEPSVSVPFGDLTVHTCGPWCQGPVVGQMLRLVEAGGLHRRPHNSAAYIHGLVEATKLAFADRHHHYIDPRYGKVPLDGLLSAAYAASRARLIDPARAFDGFPPPGDPTGFAAAGGPALNIAAAHQPLMDTSYLCVVDSKGNVFSATPSDASYDQQIVPGTGLAPSGRGCQSWADPAAPASVAPGKRPRLTPNPALAVGRDGRMIPFGTPGGDVQAQAMVQVLLNREVFGMDPQQAIEAPRFATFSFPNSFEPHSFLKNRLEIEARIAPDTGTALAAAGHEVSWWPEWSWKAGAVCMIDSDPKRGVHLAGADPRRACLALGS